MQSIPAKENTYSWQHCLCSGKLHCFCFHQHTLKILDVKPPSGFVGWCLSKASRMCRLASCDLVAVLRTWHFTRDPLLGAMTRLHCAELPLSPAMLGLLTAPLSTGATEQALPLALVSCATRGPLGPFCTDTGLCVCLRQGVRKPDESSASLSSGCGGVCPYATAGCPGRLCSGIFLDSLWQGWGGGVGWSVRTFLTVQLVSLQHLGPLGYGFGS